MCVCVCVCVCACVHACVPACLRVCVCVANYMYSEIKNSRNKGHTKISESTVITCILSQIWLSLLHVTGKQNAFLNIYMNSLVHAIFLKVTYI